MAAPERVDCFGSNKILEPGCHSIEESLYVQHHLNFIGVFWSQLMMHPRKDDLRERDHLTVSLYRNYVLGSCVSYLRPPSAAGWISLVLPPGAMTQFEN